MSALTSGQRLVFVCWTAVASSVSGVRAQSLPPRPVEASTPLDASVPVSDMLILDEAVVEVSPAPPVRGDVAIISIAIPNRDMKAWHVSINAELNPTALYRRATDTPSIRGRITEPFLAITWPPLTVPARSVATVRYEVILRYEDAGPLVTSVHLSGQDEKRTYVASARKDFQFETVWGTTDSVETISLIGCLATAGGLFLLALPAIVVVWRAGQRYAPRRAAWRAGAISIAAFAAILAAALSLSWWSDRSLRGQYQETTCQVTDRMLHERARSSVIANKSTPVYALLLAVEAQRPEGHTSVIAGDSDAMPGELYVDRGAHERYAAFVPGRSYPCWYHVTRPREMSMQSPGRTPVVIWVMIGLLLLLSAPGIALLRTK